MTVPGGSSHYPGFDVLGQSSHWDPVTRRVVQARLRHGWKRRFFNEREESLCRALVDRLLAQDQEPRIPVFEMIDHRLAAGPAAGDGYRYEDMPEDAEVWRRSLAELDRLGFLRRAREARLRLLDDIRTAEVFADMPAKRLWDLWMRYVCTAYYSHPWAWNEIGFGGPAYPRGYKNLGIGRREPWEVPERRPRDPVPMAREEEEKRAG